MTADSLSARHVTNDPGSELCLACGVCCRGVIYPDALIEPDELELVDATELPVHQNSDGADVFKLPCQYHKDVDNRCSIYDNRFHVCRRYECDLLKLLNQGGIELADALAIVSATCGHEDELYKRLGCRDKSRSLWAQIEEFLASIPGDSLADKGKIHGKIHAEVLLHARALALLCQKHFEQRIHPDVRLKGRWRIVHAP